MGEFDKHRRGKYDLKAPNYGRRCLPVDQLPKWRKGRHGWTSRPVRLMRHKGEFSTISAEPGQG